MRKLNIYHRKDGRYEGRISKGKQKNGKRSFLYFFGKTKADVERKMALASEAVNCNEKCGLTIAEVFEKWYQTIRNRIKESTAANYQMKAKKHIFPNFGEIQITSLTATEVNEFVDAKLAEGLSARYIADIIILMKSIYKFAANTYHISNPMSEVSVPRKRSSEIMLLDADEQKRLQRYLDVNPDRTTMGIALSLHMGIRIGELCALQWSDIDLKKRILTVRKTIQRIQCQEQGKRTKLIVTEPKSESSKRCIPIPEFLLDILKKFSGNTEEFVLSGKTNPIEPRTMQYRFAKILKNVKLPSIHFHALRHMFASNCVKLGFDIKTLSEILGHSSVDITLNRYVHSSFEQKVEYMKLLKPAV